MSARAAWLLPLTLLGAQGRAATAYVTDQLVLNVYSEINQQGQRLATLHSGSSVEALGTSGEYTQVKLGDGTNGWVKSSYLTSETPAMVRVKELQEELDRTRATTPALAEAAAKSELERLRGELAAKQSELEAATAARNDPGAPAPLPSPRPLGVGTLVVAALTAGALGFWGGYAVLARRVRRKFGGLRVY
jgi:uncharacterized protein YgiM (DUF1202 family)